MWVTKLLAVLGALVLAGVLLAQQYNVPFSPPPEEGGGGDTPIAAADWSGSVLSRVQWNSESSDTYADTGAGGITSWNEIGGTDCPGVALGLDGTTKLEGAASLHTQVTSCRPECPSGDSNCLAIQSMTGDYTFFTLVRHNDGATNTNRVFDNQASNVGFQATFSTDGSSLADWVCTTEHGTAADDGTAAAGAAVDAGNWAFAVCRYDLSERDLFADIWEDGASVASSSDTDCAIASNGTQTPRWNDLADNVRIDDSIVDDVYWSNVQIAFVAACEVDGQFCKCSNDTPANFFDCESDGECGGNGVCDESGTANTTNCPSGRCCRGRYNPGAAAAQPDFNMEGTDIGDCNASAPS